MEPDQHRRSSSGSFLPRLASSLALWAVAFGIIFSGFEIGFCLLIGTIGLRALWEYFRMLDAGGRPHFKLFGMTCGAALLVGSFFYYSSAGVAHAHEFELAVLLVFLLGVFTRQMFERTRDDQPLETMALTLFGLLYVLWLFNFVTKIVYVVPRGDHGQVMGHFYVLYLIIVTKFSDMGAYLVGSVMGRHKLIPHISPQKTWEGFFGGLLFSVMGSFALYSLMPGQLPGMTWVHATVLGLLLGFAAVIGDLAESIVKRSMGVKDSGRMLPGIGGALDLIDSLLFTAPLLFFYLQLVIKLK